LLADINVVVAHDERVVMVYVAGDCRSTRRIALAVDMDIYMSARGSSKRSGCGGDGGAAVLAKPLKVSIPHRLTRQMRQMIMRGLTDTTQPGSHSHRADQRRKGRVSHDAI
jgi:hypothetical protein